jgi:hypothetical protein
MSFEEKRRKRKLLQESYAEVDVNKVIRATLIGMEDTGAGSKKQE